MTLLQAEMMGGYFIIQVLKFIGLVIAVVAGIFIIGTTIRKFNERNDDISKTQ